MQFHLLSFEGPDAYSRVGGLATRIDGLIQTLDMFGFETHLWFVGDPDLPGYEVHGAVHLHRWAQSLSRQHPHGVYAGETEKTFDYAGSLPPYLLREVAMPHIRAGGRIVVLAEEWQTADALLHLDWLLRRDEVRDRASLLWNANNTFGFERIDWKRLSEAATITTVSRYMKHRMRNEGVEALVIPNGLPADAFDPPDPSAVAKLRRRFKNRTLLTKMARWDPDKRWMTAIEIIAEMKRLNWEPLLVARGGWEPYGGEVLAAARDRGLIVVEREWAPDGVNGLLHALQDINGADVVNLSTHVDPGSRRVLFRSADAVLANSGHEPFGLVGLEAMAAGGVACTGCSGEDYAIPGQNALVLETEDPHEFLSLFQELRSQPGEIRSIRDAGRSTARRYTWPRIVRRVVLPRIDALPAAY
jgi:glycosyltransferase involved in cell wall biosynthesis